uniref:G-protein coupled receptors family 1 profile domain-containing protein n=1 Tax=Mastacembelus armatus TaxID=205130 RepID=A0A3Q3MQ70_9TELE
HIWICPPAFPVLHLRADRGSEPARHHLSLPLQAQTNFSLMFRVFADAAVNRCCVVPLTLLFPCRQLHTPTNLLLLSLAVSDFLLGLVVTPLEVLRHTSCWFQGDLMCSLYNYVSCVIDLASVLNLVLISVDRYVAICCPLHYPTRVTLRRTLICVCLCWLWSGIIPAPESVSSSSTWFQEQLTQVFVVAVSQVRAMRSHVTAVTLQRSGTVKTKKSELKAARTLGVVVAVFLLCYCPYHCLFFVKDSPVSALPSALAVFMLCLKPFLNPLIYALFYPWFRKAARLIVTVQLLQPGSCHTNML